MSRTLKVQTPGAPTPAPEAAPVETQTTQPAEAQQATPAPEADSEQPAQAPAEPPARAPRTKPTNYSQMRAADIDPAQLTAPVLSLDGWVMPLAPAKRHPSARD